MTERPTRIDAFRRDMTELRDLIDMILASAEDLHVLAYDRKVAAAEHVSASGPVHFYLDQHGDLRARQAMKDLMRAMPGAFEAVDRAARKAKAILTEGAPPKRNRECGPRTASTAEVFDALAARSRRAARGEYTSTRLWPQPEAETLIAELRDRVKKLERALEKEQAS